MNIRVVCSEDFLLYGRSFFSNCLEGGGGGGQVKGILVKA